MSMSNTLLGTFALLLLLLYDVLYYDGWVHMEMMAYGMF